MVSAPETYHYAAERVRGYRMALRDAGNANLEIVHASYGDEKAREKIVRMMSEWGPDGLFVGAGGEFLLEALRAISERSSGPTTIGFTTFDDYTFLDFLSPGITAVRQPLSQMGTEATRMLLTLISGAEPEQHVLVLPATLVERQSCPFRAD